MSVLHRPEDATGRDRYGFAPVVIASGIQDLVCVAGQLPTDAAAPFPEQARQAFAALERALRAGGASPATTLRITCLVVSVDQARLEELSQARRAIFGDARPTSTVINVDRLVGPGLLLEVDALAVLDPQVEATDFVLPARRGGPAPTSTPTPDKPVPHAQLGQNAPPELQAALHERARRLSGVRVNDSLVSVPGARAYHLRDDVTPGPPEAFQAGREFAHLHPEPDGSLHLTLPAALARVVVETGWGEPHPLSGTTLLFGPRDDDELEIVWALLRRSHAWATQGASG